MEKQNFFKNHADTLAIIAVNIAIAAMILNMNLANTQRVDVANQRSDDLYKELILVKKEANDIALKVNTHDWHINWNREGVK